MVITYNGQLDPKIERDVATLPNYKDREFVYVDAYKMPFHPPQGTEQILLNCDPSNYFHDKFGAYKDLPVSRLIWDAAGHLFTTRHEGFGLKSAM